VICESARSAGKSPRRISFTRTCSTILASWSNLASGRFDEAAVLTLLERIATLEVPDRPGRIEPRVLKRRRHRYALMRKPRAELKKRLQATTRSGKMT